MIGSAISRPPQSFMDLLLNLLSHYTKEQVKEQVNYDQSFSSVEKDMFLQKQSREFRKVVLSGYPNPNSAAGAGIALTGILSAFKGAKGFSGLVDGMVLGPFSKAVAGAKTPQDWLSVNEENVRRYVEDPLCGARFTLGSYNALFRMIDLMNKPENYRDVRKDLPILLISGREDPCTGGEKGRQDSLDILQKAGFSELTVKTLDGMRHEILNENRRDEVCRDIIEFLNKP